MSLKQFFGQFNIDFVLFIYLSKQHKVANSIDKKRIFLHEFCSRFDVGCISLMLEKQPWTDHDFLLEDNPARK